MLGYSYNGIAISITVIMLESLSARFVHPATPQPTILPFFQQMLEHKKIKTFNKMFFLTALAPELSKYLNEWQGVSLNVKQQK